MFELVFLGTSASAPSVQRGLSAAMVLHREYRFLIDCGEGTQRQILRSGLGFKRLERILLTHGHLDHILGLGGLASTFGRWEAIDEMEIHGGVGALSRVRELMRVVFGAAETKINIAYRAITPGVLLEDELFRFAPSLWSTGGPRRSVSASRKRRGGPSCPSAPRLWACLRGRSVAIWWRAMR